MTTVFSLSFSICKLYKEVKGGDYSISAYNYFDFLHQFTKTNIRSCKLIRQILLPNYKLFQTFAPIWFFVYEFFEGRVLKYRIEFITQTDIGS